MAIIVDSLGCVQTKLWQMYVINYLKIGIKIYWNSWNLFLLTWDFNFIHKNIFLFRNVLCALFCNVCFQSYITKSET
jgi:hypothetical protein